MKVKFLYTGIEVSDMDKSIKFYKLLGMKLAGRQKIPATKGEVAYLRTHGSQQLLELNFYQGRKAYKHGSELDHLAFEVNNIDTTIPKLVKHGAKKVYRMMKGKTSRWTYVTDPDGIWIELVDKHP
jgi:lactoylglutathione lyase